LGLTGGDANQNLANFIAARSGGDDARIHRNDLLVGGAIQENRALDVDIVGGELSGPHEFVLRTEALSSVPETRSLGQQFAMLSAAYRAGVTVPEPLWYCDDVTVTGRPFYLMRRIGGEALGSRIVRHAPHDKLAQRLGRELAIIHTITPPREELAFLDLPKNTPARDSIAKYRAYLDVEPEPHPALEWGLRWLELNAPATDEIVLAHHDFRTGNYMVDDGELTGVLDWEFAGWSDPHEDLAWFCAKCWRFGSSYDAGGIANREKFFDAYEAQSGRIINRDIIPYWEVMAHVRWAIVALHQCARHRSGEEPSLDMALVGRRLAELEYEILILTGAI
jgi:aminoglycoside phosphotransferase (APT) family kinase protein